MGSTFGGIEIGKRALQAQQKAMKVTGHNISNANNDEYSRQRAIQSATNPHPYPALYNSTGAGQIGTGVEVSRIERIRDQFIDKRFRYENQALGKWSMVKENLKEIETVFNELDEGGVVNTLDEFWNSFQELANNPESLAVRESVIQKGVTLTTQFNHFNKGLVELRKDLGTEIEGRVNKFNSLTARIADVNEQIKAIETGNNVNANDLMDKRDKLIDQLSKLADIQYTVDDTNQVNISLNGNSIVQGKFQNNLEFDKTSYSDVSDDGETYNNISQYEFEVEGNAVEIKSGEINGLMTSRDKIQDYKMNKLDRLVRALRDQLNTQHQSGRGLTGGDTSRNFFTGDDASDIAIRDVIKNNPGYIAAADSWQDTDPNDGTNDFAGDGSNALTIAQLRDNGTIAGSEFNDFWQTQSSKLGIDIGRAERMETNQEVLVDSLKQKREEKSGVSLDEEMTQMIKYQHGYSAAAKVISQMDEMFGVLNSIIR